MSTDPKPYAMSVVEAGKHAGLSRSSILRLIDANELPSLKVMGRRLVLREDVERLLLSKRDAA